MIMAITIQEIVDQIRQSLSQHSDSPSLDAQVLVAHCMEKPRSWVLAHPEALLNDRQYDAIVQASNRLYRGEPLPYVLGHWEFFGIDFKLTPDVLIPRPETELLVERGLDWLRLHPTSRQIIDVGTGSGCIAIALAMNIPNLHILLADISPQALKVARVNAENYGLCDRLEFQQADLLEGIAGPCAVICANLPYIPTLVLKNLPVIDKEPQLALDGGIDGIELINRLLYQARSRLSPGGLILLEIEASQGAEAVKLAQALYPAAKVNLLKDLSGQDRCLEIERSNLIVHLCQCMEWSKAQALGSYKSITFNQEGYIHCSQPEQILQVANRFYHDVPELVLLWIDPAKITSEIRWETSDDELFPHIYGPIDLVAVVSVTELNEPDGFPPGPITGLIKNRRGYPRQDMFGRNDQAGYLSCLLLLVTPVSAWTSKLTTVLFGAGEVHF
jgi:release factor glutamine methyltransferase